MTSDGKSSCFFGIDISSKGINPTEVIPNNECNPTIFMRGSVSSSEIDKIVDDCNQVNANVSIKDMKVIVDKRPGRQQCPDAIVVSSCSGVFPSRDVIVFQYSVSKSDNWWSNVEVFVV